MKARVKETGATFHVLGVVSNKAEGYRALQIKRIRPCMTY